MSVLYWTKNNCLAAARQCKSRREFQNRFGRGYFIARRENWIDECCSHMHKLGSKHKRLIYAFKFKDKSVYVGLTYNSTERKKLHIHQQEKING